MTKRYLISISYDGSSFNGWAKQINLFTVQGFIEKKLSLVFSLNQVKILASSRTDKGVHALDQNFTLTLPFDVSCKSLSSIFTKSLQGFVVLNKIREIPFAFDPLRDVLLKEYRYYINTNCCNLFLRKYCWNYNSDIDLTKLRKLLKVFEGFHNFFNFSYCRLRDQDRKNTYRKIEKISVSRKGDFLVIRILAKSFLRYQIRAIIGEVVSALSKPEICRNLGKMLNTEYSGKKYKRLAPAGGLYLWKISFLNKSKKNDKWR